MRRDAGPHVPTPKTTTPTPLVSLQPSPACTAATMEVAEERVKTALVLLAMRMHVFSAKQVAAACREAGRRGGEEE